MSPFSFDNLVGGIAPPFQGPTVLEILIPEMGCPLEYPGHSGIRKWCAVRPHGFFDNDREAY
jgi:hypothetical protein